MTDEPADTVADIAADIVAGALTAEESAAVDARLAAGDKPLRAALLALDAVNVALAESVAKVIPPTAIKQRILAQIKSAAKPQALGGLMLLRSSEGRWQATGQPGVERRILHRDPDRRQVTQLLRMAPGARLAAHDHAGPEEVYILEGDVTLGESTLAAGDYQFAPAGSHHREMISHRGCIALVVACF